MTGNLENDVSNAADKHLTYRGVQHFLRRRKKRVGFSFFTFLPLSSNLLPSHAFFELGASEARAHVGRLQIGSCVSA